MIGVSWSMDDNSDDDENNEDEIDDMRGCEQIEGRADKQREGRRIRACFR